MQQTEEVEEEENRLARHVRAQQREAAAVAAAEGQAQRAAAANHRAVVAEAEVSLAEAEVEVVTEQRNYAEHVNHRNAGATDRLLVRIDAKFNRILRGEVARVQQRAEAAEMYAADLEQQLVEVAEVAKVVRKAQQKARRQVNDQAWDAVAARAVAAAAVAQLGPVVIAD